MMVFADELKTFTQQIFVDHLPDPKHCERHWEPSGKQGGALSSGPFPSGETVLYPHHLIQYTLATCGYQTTEVWLYCS